MEDKEFIMWLCGTVIVFGIFIFYFVPKWEKNSFAKMDSQYQTIRSKILQIHNMQSLVETKNDCESFEKKWTGPNFIPKITELRTMIAMKEMEMVKK